MCRIRQQARQSRPTRQTKRQQFQVLDGKITVLRQIVVESPIVAYARRKTIGKRLPFTLAMELAK